MFNSSEHRKLSLEGIQSIQDVLNNYTEPKSTACRFCLKYTVGDTVVLVLVYKVLDYIHDTVRISCL